MRWKPLAGLGTVCLVAALAACDDSTGADFDPILVSDTVLVAAPLPQNAELPTALDITGNPLGAGVVGGRFPELPRDLLEWDFLVRVEEGRIVLVPGRAVGVESGSGITEALSGETFDGLREVPGQSTLVSDRGVPLALGAVYAARSRQTTGGFFGVCIQFAKLTPLELDVAGGTARIRIVTNTRCSDPRLVEPD